jgi:hypothetical protein
LCGRRTFYQLLVCDNAKATDVGAPYYSDQQLFPGFMMAEFDGDTLSFGPPSSTPTALQPCASLLLKGSNVQQRAPLFNLLELTCCAGQCWMTCSDFCNDKIRDWCEAGAVPFLCRFLTALLQVQDQLRC